MNATKRCCTCGSKRPLAEFNVRTAAADGLQSRCRACCKRWYRENRVTHIAMVRRRNNATRNELVLRLGVYLAEHPCVDCGERDIRCLEFDHRDRQLKVADVSKLVTDSRSWTVVLREIEKCDVRCANCHRRKTSAEINSWRQRVFDANPVTGAVDLDGTA